MAARRIGSAERPVLVDVLVAAFETGAAEVVPGIVFRSMLREPAAPSASLP